MKSERMLWQQRHGLPDAARYENPLFPRRQEARQRTARRVRRVLLLCGLLLLAGNAALVFASPFQLRYVSVEGVCYQRPGTVEHAMEEYLGQRYLWVLPKSSFLLFSASRAEAFLRAKLPAAQAIAAIRMTKRFPALVQVTVEERTPNLVYVSGGTTYLMDRQGYIAQLPQTKEKGRKSALDVSFPVLHDQNPRLAAVGAQMVLPGYVTFLFAARDALQATDIPVDVWYLPSVVCLPQPETKEPENNTKSADRDDDRPVTENTNAKSSANKQEQQGKQTPTSSRTKTREEGNANTSPEEPFVPQCDTAEGARTSRDLRMRTTEGWDIYFRTDDDAVLQVQRVMEVLAGQRLDRTKIHYIDVRFGDRVQYR